MKGKHLIPILLINVITMVGVYFLLHYFTATKIGFVRSYDLVYEYEGTKEAMVKFERQKSEWQGNVDTLKADWQKSINQYNADYQFLSGQERASREDMLNRQKQQMDMYEQAIDKKIQDEDSKMMEAVLNQVNAFVEDYARDNGYEIILGTTTSGSLLYGEEGMDITEQVLASLNQKYRGE